MTNDPLISEKDNLCIKEWFKTYTTTYPTRIDTVVYCEIDRRFYHRNSQGEWVILCDN